MPRFRGMPAYEHGTPALTGVLLCNLGTPDAPTASAVRRYLAEFLWDPRVVEVPRPLWWLILHGFILRTRPGEVAHKYEQIWDDAGSPLRVISDAQATALQQAFEASFPGAVRVAYAMRYGKPSIPKAMREMADAGVQRLLVLPAYPQYSGSTTASTFDAVARELMTWRWLPELRFVRNYHDQPGYIAALAASVREHWSRYGRRDRLLMSFHGVPKRYLTNGDPYHCECLKTARLLAEALGLSEGEWYAAFQSRFGREEWLKPYTDVTLREWAKGGLKGVDVICPGFSADCLETLEEIAIQNRQLFLDHGGEELSYIPALNARPDHIAFLHELAAEHMSGWL
ncbi:MAG: ferrochelatase [Xanthomonadaceae bacterium]|nr:ferrochelatase [Xanthomonadaceae bacterium]